MVNSIPILELEGEVIVLTVVGTHDLCIGLEVAGEVRRIKRDGDTVWIGSFHCDPELRVEPDRVSSKDSHYRLYLRTALGRTT